MRRGIAVLSRQWNAWKRRRTAGWFRPGKAVRGRYVVVKPLGEGSYGLAYLCRDRKAGGRLCVLKHVQPNRGGHARTRSTYELETDMLLRLRHPSIPKLIERFDYRGALCFTMEYAPGTSLEKRLFDDEWALTEKESLLLLRELAGIVGYIHREGVVHRDIRIANVIVDGDRVHLIDFGLARELRTAPGTPVRTGAAPGQPSGRAVSGERPGSMPERSLSEHTLPDDVSEDDPTEKKLRRRVAVESDFYAMGHLLLYLLYSSYPDDNVREEEQGWEEELSELHPLTKKMIRRLLMAEQTYQSIDEVTADLDAALGSLSGKPAAPAPSGRQLPH